MLFNWLAMQKENLNKRGWTENPLCALCNSAIEDSTRLFLFCPFTCEIRSYFIDLTAIFSLDADLQVGQILSLIHANLFELRYTTRNTIMLALLWRVRLARNNVIFLETTS